MFIGTKKVWVPYAFSYMPNNADIAIPQKWNFLNALSCGSKMSNKAKSQILGDKSLSSQKEFAKGLVNSGVKQG